MSSRAYRDPRWSLAVVRCRADHGRDGASADADARAGRRLLRRAQRHRLRRQACEDCVVRPRSALRGRAWDQFCVADTTDCAAECQCDRTPSPTPTPGGDCCSPHGGTGCDVASCQACVCGSDSTCCNMIWDATCVAEASSDCLADCPCTAPPTETPAPTPTPGGDCCSAHAGGQCDDNACEACVCGVDAECCYRGVGCDCAIEASVECALQCACPGAEDCCAAHDSVSLR